MPTQMEIIQPALNVVNAQVTCNEHLGVQAPNIITTGSHLDVNFQWTTVGALWNLPFGGNWELEVFLEKVGPGEKANPPMTLVANVAAPTVYNQTVHLTVGGGAGDLNPGDIYIVFAKITLRVNGVMLACGFAECDTVHIMDV